MVTPPAPNREPRWNRATLKRQIGALVFVVVSGLIVRFGNWGLVRAWQTLRSQLSVGFSIAVCIAACLLASFVIAAFVGPLREAWRFGTIVIAYATKMTPYWMLEVRHLCTVGTGRGLRGFDSEEQFYSDDQRRRPSHPDTDQLDFGVHWRDGRRHGGQRLTWIESTRELIFVGPDNERNEKTVEIVATVSNEWMAERRLEGWAYACMTPHGMRWVRRRARGWRVPLPPRGRKWYLIDSSPLTPWPSPPQPSMEKTIGSYHGIQGDDDTVFVQDSDGQRPLYQYVDSSPTGMSWGYGGAGPSDLARSMLADRLGYVPNRYVWLTFRNEVIAALPPEFILKFSEVDEWIGSNKVLFARDPRSEPFDPYARGGQ
jgi:hypothetical protein